MLSIIVATDLNGGIGYKGDLLFKIKEDLKRFKELTMSHKVVMGMKTFLSLPCVLEGREEIVLTRQIVKDNHNHATIINDINKIIDNYKDSKEEVFIIGGGEIYKQFLPYCKKIYLTRVLGKYEADTFFKYNKDDFQAFCTKTMLSNEYSYKFVELYRKSK